MNASKVLRLVLCMGAIGAVSAQAASAASLLDSMRYLVGSWTCTSKTSDGSASGTATYRLGLNDNAIEFEYGNAHYLGSGYFTIYPQNKSLVVVASDAYGGAFRETGKPDADGTLVLTGVGNYGTTSPVRETITKTANGFHDVSEMQIRGLWQTQDDTTCTKS